MDYSWNLVATQVPAGSQEIIQTFPLNIVWNSNVLVNKKINVCLIQSVITNVLF